MRLMRSMLSESVQNYLKAIYRLREDGPRVSTNALAERLSIAPASVTGMVKKLAEIKLVDYEPYQGVQLTQGGERVALEIIRHHRLIELYLTQAMGYPWDRVHEEAERLEHAISEEFEDRISNILGNPTYDPHGDPIPAKDGSVAVPSRSTLAELAPGDSARVARVRDDDPLFLRKCGELGLRPSAIVTMIENLRDTDSLTVALRSDSGTNERHVLTREFAQKINIMSESVAGKPLNNTPQ